MKLFKWMLNNATRPIGSIVSFVGGDTGDAWLQTSFPLI